MENALKKKRKNPIASFGLWIAFIVFALYSISLLFPFIWILINSFRNLEEWRAITTINGYWSLPSKWEFGNYITTLTKSISGDDNILSMIFYSVLLTVLGTIVNVFFSACAAYVVAKYEFPGKKLLFSLAIFAMVVPIVGTLPAQVRFMEMLHLDDSVIGVLFLYSGAFGFNFILLHSAFQSISWNYAEAAQMDGAGHFSIFFKVMIPMCKGPIISCCILQAITLWNDYSTPFLFLKSHKTLAVGLQSIQAGLANSQEYPIMFAAIIISILPVLILYAAFQKKIIENTVAGGLKG
ncbi:MAG: carbohydrate ABC transporter permease [Erysipelotrichales bacterium]|nr:carbohydrate ABC transporter permease [Erysipelotrichales bacterium]